MPDDQVSEALAKEASLVGTDYSRDFVSEHAAANVLPIAHRDGRYKAKVAGVSARAAVPAGECGGGVEVTIQIVPGLRYTWSRVEWTGAGALTGAEVARTIRVADGQPADVSLLADGLAALKSLYHRRGYMAAGLLPVETVDEAARTVACRLMVVEGPRFRLRSVEVTGLEPELASRIRGRWTLAPGEFYDGAYTKAFVSETRKLEREALAGRTNVTIREKPDAATTSVDLILEFARPGG
jgi:outer membrane protein assembly factor BamA